MKRTCGFYSSPIEATGGSSDSRETEWLFKGGNQERQPRAPVNRRQEGKLVKQK